MLENISTWKKLAITLILLFLVGLGVATYQEINANTKASNILSTLNRIERRVKIPEDATVYVKEVDNSIKCGPNGFAQLGYVCSGAIKYVYTTNETFESIHANVEKIANLSSYSLIPRNAIDTYENQNRHVIYFGTTRDDSVMARTELLEPSDNSKNVYNFSSLQEQDFLRLRSYANMHSSEFDDSVIGRLFDEHRNGKSIVVQYYTSSFFFSNCFPSFHACGKSFEIKND